MNKCRAGFATGTINHFNPKSILLLILPKLLYIVLFYFFFVSSFVLLLTQCHIYRTITVIGLRKTPNFLTWWCKWFIFYSTEVFYNGSFLMCWRVFIIKHLRHIRYIIVFFEYCGTVWKASMYRMSVGNWSRFWYYRDSLYWNPCITGQIIKLVIRKSSYYNKLYFLGKHNNNALR